MHVAAQEGHLAVVNVLLDHDALPDALTTVSRSSSRRGIVMIVCVSLRLFVCPSAHLQCSAGRLDYCKCNSSSTGVIAE